MSRDLENMSWSIAEGDAADYPFQLRFRHFDDKFPRNGFPRRLNIFWSMTEPDERGYAAKTELERLHTFEDRLVAAVETDGFSVLAIVLTGRGEREFVFYTPDPKEFVKRLSMMPQEEERYPIEIHLNEDPNWDYFEDELRNVRNA